MSFHRHLKAVTSTYKLGLLRHVLKTLKIVFVVVVFCRGVDS